MLLNYHEMTMNEPRHSKAKQQQFLIICLVMATAFCYSCLNAGVFTIDIQSHVNTKGIFPGGYYINKFGQRDYSSSNSLGRNILYELYNIKTNDWSNEETLLYYIYLDNPQLMGGRRQRFYSGILCTNEEMKNINMEKVTKINTNLETTKKPLSTKDYNELPVIDIWKRTSYNLNDLQSVNSLILHYPYTGGFVSALLFSYRILPLLRRLGIEHSQEKDNVPVVISNCSLNQQMCTHYVPLVQGKDFLLGNDDTTTFLSKLPKENYIDLQGLKQGANKLLPFEL